MPDSVNLRLKIPLLLMYFIRKFYDKKNFSGTLKFRGAVAPCPTYHDAAGKCHDIK